MRANSLMMRKRARSCIVGYSMILPAVILFAVFCLIPIAQSFLYGFYKWDGITQKTFVGLQNYVDMLTDPIVGLSFVNNILYTIGIIALGVFPGLLLAYMLTKDIWGRLALRTVYFLPRVVSAVIYGIVWKWIYDPIFGLITKAAETAGLRIDIAVLGSVKTAMIGIVIAGGWTYFGFCMVIFLAALQNVDKSLEESAVLDGAGKARIFFRITLPTIRPVFTMVILYTIIDSFKVFDLVLTMTNGGPSDATSIMTYLIYKQAFRLNNFGYSSAISVALALFLLIFSIWYQKSQEEGGI